MKSKDRLKYLLRSPLTAWDILVRGRYDYEYDLMPVRAENMPIKKRLNLARASLNLLFRRASSWSWPINMHIELVNYCNINCRVCPTGLGELSRKPQAMDPALFERLLDEAGPYLMTASLWSWGEPLLHPQLSRMLRIAQNRGITTFLSTNGQILDQTEVLQALIDYPPTYLIVCVDGISDETNTQFRTNAKLGPVLKGVKQLARMKAERGQAFPILHMRYIVMKHNEHELPLLPGFAKENDFDMLTIRTLAIIDSPDDIHKSLMPDTEEFRAYTYEDQSRVKLKDFICEKVFTFPAMFADGTIAACDQDCNGTQTYGSIAGGSSFKSLWWSKQADQIRRTVRDAPEKFSFCLNCPFKDMPVATVSRKRYIFKPWLPYAG